MIFHTLNNIVQFLVMKFDLICTIHPTYTISRHNKKKTKHACPPMRLGTGQDISFATRKLNYTGAKAFIDLCFQEIDSYHSRPDLNCSDCIFLWYNFLNLFQVGNKGSKTRLLLSIAFGTWSINKVEDHNALGGEAREVQIDRGKASVDRPCICMRSKH